MIFLHETEALECEQNPSFLLPFPAEAGPCAGGSQTQYPNNETMPGGSQQLTRSSITTS
jgi:hypothetical protein